MRTHVRSILLATAALRLVCPQATHARTQDVPYHLAQGSDMEYGCFGPCACPVLVSGPMTGTFTLHLASVDPLYSHYDVLDVAWTYATGDTGTEFIAHASGQGTYDIGGEAAMMQRLTLDLTIDDPRLPPFMQHYDSGLVPARATFPAIDVDAHLKVDSCRDSVFRVVAKPTGSNAVEPATDRPVLLSARPNPTTTGIEVIYAPKDAARVQVDVIDVNGRVVRNLVDGSIGPGEHRVSWDGRDTRGVDAGVGMFWIRVRAGAHTERLRIARLH